MAAFCAYNLPVAQFDRRFIILGLAMLVGSRVTIEIPRAKGHISVSDTFVFLTLMLFGGHAAVVLAATEALTSSRRFSRKPIALQCRRDGMFHGCDSGGPALRFWSDNAAVEQLFSELDSSALRDGFRAICST